MSELLPEEGAVVKSINLELTNEEAAIVLQAIAVLTGRKLINPVDELDEQKVLVDRVRIGDRILSLLGNDIGLLELSEPIKTWDGVKAAVLHKVIPVIGTGGLLN